MFLIFTKNKKKKNFFHIQFENNLSSRSSKFCLIKWKGQNEEKLTEKHKLQPNKLYCHRALFNEHFTVIIINNKISKSIKYIYKFVLKKNFNFKISKFSLFYYYFSLFPYFILFFSLFYYYFSLFFSIFLFAFKFIEKNTYISKYFAVTRNLLVRI